MVYVPIITPISKQLYPRKGGGGHGNGRSGGGGGGKSGSSGGGGKSSPKASGPSISSGGGSFRTSSSGKGGGKPYNIPAGQPFAGRQVGGGTRYNVYGTQYYGSGYPGYSDNGVRGRGFPFFFWPIVWVGATAGYTAGYIYAIEEYGGVYNGGRPGGYLQQIRLIDDKGSSTFKLVADNTTLASLISSLNASCSLGSISLPMDIPLNSSDSELPRPEQAIQYYRASSAVLTLDGYNNTAAFQDDVTIPNVPLPSWVNTTFLGCLNQTIGSSILLVDGASGSWNTPSLGLLFFLWFIVLRILFI